MVCKKGREPLRGLQQKECRETGGLRKPAAESSKETRGGVVERFRDSALGDATERGCNVLNGSFAIDVVDAKGTVSGVLP